MNPGQNEIVICVLFVIEYPFAHIDFHYIIKISIFHVPISMVIVHRYIFKKKNCPIGEIDIRASRTYSDTNDYPVCVLSRAIIEQGIRKKKKERSFFK